MSVIIGIDYCEKWYEIAIYNYVTNKFESKRNSDSSFEEIILNLKNKFNEKFMKIYVIEKENFLNDKHFEHDSSIHWLSKENLDFTNYLSVKPSPDTKILQIDGKASSTVKCVLYEFVSFDNNVSKYKPIKCFETRIDVKNFYEELIDILDCNLSNVHLIIYKIHANDFFKELMEKQEHFCSFTMSSYLHDNDKAVIYGRFILNDENIQSLFKLKECSSLSDIRIKNFDFNANEHIISYRQVNIYQSQTKLMGIDLGSSRIVVCISRNNSAQLVKIDQEYAMPSVISFIEKEPIIGSVAMRHLAPESKSVLYDLKYMMDTKRNLDEGSWPFGLVTTTEKSSFVVKSQGKFEQYSTVEIYRILLEKLKTAASEYQLDLNDGESVNQAVITVPNFDNEMMLADICQAANLVGIKIIDIITETHADLLYFLTKNELRYLTPDQTVIVVDIGGGTAFIQKFSTVQSFGKKHDLSFLCGRKINELLKKELLQFLFEEYKIKIINDFKILAGIERIKEILSFEETTHVDLPRIFYQHQDPIQVTRTWFERKVMEKLFTHKTRKQIMEEAIEDMNRFPGFSKVFLVGGTCRIPYIQNYFKSVFGGDKVVVSDDLQGITASGALIHGLQILNGEIDSLFKMKTNELSLSEAPSKSAKTSPNSKMVKIQFKDSERTSLIKKTNSRNWKKQFLKHET